MFVLAYCLFELFNPIGPSLYFSKLTCQSPLCITTVHAVGSRCPTNPSLAILTCAKSYQLSEFERRREEGGLTPVINHTARIAAIVDWDTAEGGKM